MKTALLRRTGAALLAAGALVSLAACGSDQKVPSAGHDVTHVAASAAATTSAAASSAPAVPSSGLPTVTPGKDGNPDYCANQAPATGPVADAFGADNVKQAYCEMVAFTLDDSSFVGNLLVPKVGNADRTATEFSFVKKYMTARMQATWDGYVTAALKGDATAIQQVYSLTFFDLNGNGMVVSDTPNLVANKKFSPATLDEDKGGPNGAARLVLKFQITADINVTVNNVPKTLHVTKDVDYALVPTGQTDLPWVIDGYNNTYSIDASK